MATPTERQRIIAEIQRLDRQASIDAGAARKRTLEALRAAARITRSDAPGRGPAFHARAGGKAIRFPKSPPRNYSRAGVSYHRSAVTNPDGTLRTTFHMRLTNCDNTATAAAHQSYIDREQAVTFSTGNIAETSAERQAFWRALEPAMNNKLGSIPCPRTCPTKRVTPSRTAYSTPSRH